ncbi:hypothetical protein SAMN04488037_101136 [Shimia marina]|uniref:Uncharacterized protein n=1 Tax=Shimia marina TaxID=321267 RepID=A0A0P1ENG0_9RHOB|nr:hypothetical protein SHM7688_00971 [Shimia marina]SFD46755.1 hypothetical protein SAMN04488037_101136 [Shimia marina]
MQVWKPGDRPLMSEFLRIKSARYECVPVVRSASSGNGARTGCFYF